MSHLPLQLPHGALSHVLMFWIRLGHIDTALKIAQESIAVGPTDQTFQF